MCKLSYQFMYSWIAAVIYFYLFTAFIVFVSESINFLQQQVITVHHIALYVPTWYCSASWLLLKRLGR